MGVLIIHWIVLLILFLWFQAGPIWLIQFAQSYFGFNKKPPTCKYDRMDHTSDTASAEHEFLVSLWCLLSVVAIVVFLEWVRYRFEPSKSSGWVGAQLVPLEQRSDIVRAWAMVHNEMTMGKLAFLSSQLWAGWFIVAARDFISVSLLMPAIFMTIVAVIAAQLLPVLQIKIEVYVGNSLLHMLNRPERAGMIREHHLPLNY